MAPPYSNGYSASSSSSAFVPPQSFASAANSSSDDNFGALFLNVLRLLGHALVRRTLNAFAALVSVLVTGSRSTGDLLLQVARSSIDDRRRQQPSASRPLLVVGDVLLRLLRHNLAPQRVFSLPHFVVAFWVLVLLWGEQGTYHASVASCHWDHWEKWPPGATPHHLVLVADPQLIDAHSYPGRPWPISALTMTVTDNYMRRSYRELQEQLRPDSVFFLGDLFDGGREWRPRHGEFAEDPAWSTRPDSEKAYARMWRRKYDDAYWMHEYSRFGDIFLKPEVFGGSDPGSDGSRDKTKDKGPGRPGTPRGRRLVASLPGNHDLGFGDEVKVSVRDRFEAYFGTSNRVDVIGNHSFVSVDTVSLSAASSDRAHEIDMRPIYGPADEFVRNVAWEKQKAVARALRHQSGRVEEAPVYARSVQDLDAAHIDLEAQKRALGQIDPALPPPADLPTVLLTHVPLYRPPGTPCGPLREHWPPADDDALRKNNPAAPPDLRNALPVARGYQYQTVLSEADSVRLVQQVGHVVHVFSGDDHDYCAVEHDERQAHVPEITVKAFSMAMGVPTPGFLMVSLYNPVDETGQPLGGALKDKDKDAQRAPTLQTHLCLLPNQLATYARYGGMVAVSLVLLAIYAVLVPILGLPAFAFDAAAGDGGGGGGGGLASELLPLYSNGHTGGGGAGGTGGVGGVGGDKIKVEDDEYGAASRGQTSNNNNAHGAATTNAADEAAAGGASDSSGFIAFRPPTASYSYSRGRNQPSSSAAYPPPPPNRHYKPKPKRSSRTRQPAAAPRIQIPADDDDDYDDSYDDDDDESSSDENEGGSVGGGAGRRFLADNDYMTEVYLGGRGGGGGDRRWRPASSRGGGGILGVGAWALDQLQRLALGGRGRVTRISSSGRRRHGRGRAGGVLGQMLRQLKGGGGGGSSTTGRRRGGGGGGGGSGGGSSGRRRRRRAPLLSIAAGEFYVMAFRVLWMVVAYWGWLNHQG